MLLLWYFYDIKKLLQYFKVSYFYFKTYVRKYQIDSQLKKYRETIFSESED